MIESSSDFIVVTWEYAKKMNQELFEKFDPIYFWEYKNWHDNSRDNIKFIDLKLQNLDLNDYIEVVKAYSDVIEYLLENENMIKLYPMKNNDIIGKKIIDELSEKHDLSKKYLNIMKYKQGAI